MGLNVVENLDPGVYTLRVSAVCAGREEEEDRRRVDIPERTGMQCSVILINDGLRVLDGGRTLVAEFRGVGGAEQFQCRLDRQRLVECEQWGILYCTVISGVMSNNY